MKSRRRVSLVLGFLLAALFAGAVSGCGKKPDMYLEKAKLSEKEEDLSELLETNFSQFLYDFSADGTVKSIQLSVYELEDGAWVRLGTCREPLKEGKGRFVLGFEDLSKSWRFAFRQDGDSSATSMETVEASGGVPSGTVTVTLENRAAVVPGEEIPLAMQFQSASGKSFRSGMDAFNTPEEYEQYGYDHVYAAAVLFSSQTVEELDAEETRAEESPQ